MKTRDEERELDLPDGAEGEAAPPPGAALGGLASGMGNAAFAAIVQRKPSGLVDPSGNPVSSKKGKSKPKDEDEEEAPEKEDAGLAGVLTKVSGAIGAIQTIQQAWDQVFKSEVKTRFVPVPAMMTDETQARLNRVLRYETSRLLCEFVFAKAKMHGVDIKALVDAKKTGAPAPAPAADAGAPKPDFSALEKDLEGLNELAMGDLKDRAAILIAERRTEPEIEPDRIWWNEFDEWGFGQAPLLKQLPWGGVKGIEFGEIWAMPRIAKLTGPAQAGLHPDVRYFNIPDQGTETVNPRWWIGGHLETKTHGRNVNDVTIDQLDTAPDQNKPMGQYRIVSTFDWDESNTIMRFILKTYADDTKAGIIGVEREGEPDVGWV